MGPNPDIFSLDFVNSSELFFRGLYGWRRRESFKKHFGSYMKDRILLSGHHKILYNYKCLRIAKFFFKIETLSDKFVHITQYQEVLSNLSYKYGISVFNFDKCSIICLSKR